MKPARATKIATEAVNHITQRGEMLPVGKFAVGIDFAGRYWVDDGQDMLLDLSKEVAARRLVAILTAK